MATAYDPSRHALFQPERGSSVFRLGPAPSDEALAVEAARLAYLRVEEAKDQADRLAAALALAGFGAPQSFIHPGTDGQGYGALRADGLALLAFRGTQPDRVSDLATDAGFLLTASDHGPGRVHAGFRNTARGLWDEVQRWLDGPAGARQRLLICGHSLGAAIATLLAVPARATQLVTIGSPRVGNAEFVTHLAATPGLAITRIVDCCDVVTEVPPAAFGFEHAGTLTYIDRKGKLSVQPSQDAVDEDRALARAEYLGRHAFRIGTLITRDLADHAPANYLRAYWP
jgi:pimeloyl-ACP methyl ester carboxylesterase